MGQILLNDNFAFDAKVLDAGNAAVGLLISSLCYCSRQRTEGFIPKGILPLLAVLTGEKPNSKKQKKCLDALLKVGFWREVEGGYRVDVVTNLWIIHSNPELFDAMRRQARRQYSAQIFERDDYKCVYCGSSDKLTLDHIIPLSRGGSNTIDNLTTACSTCNSRKNNKTPEEWRI